jgi:hypothetical protein
LPGAHRGLTVIREVAGPFGVPDFVAVVGSPERLRERLATPVPPLLNEVDAGIAAVLSTKRGKSIDSIAQSLGWTRQTVERRLPGLLRSSAVVEVHRERYVRAGALQPIGRAYAIETKVRDWRGALRQARTYRLWCDNYVIVMASLSDAMTPLAFEAIKADGGGLVSEARWIKRPRAYHPPSTRRLWGSEHIVAALGGPSPALGSPELP